MQTWLPYPDFRRSLEALDMRRLNAQCGEGLQLLQGARPTHPARLMWVGHEESLATYRNTAVAVWVLRREHKDRPHTRKFCYLDGTCYGDVVSEESARRWLAQEGPTFSAHLAPPWFGDERFHGAHKARLLSKTYLVYRDVFPTPIEMHALCECGRQYGEHDIADRCPGFADRRFVGACPWPELAGRGRYRLRWGFRDRVGGPIHYVYDDQLVIEGVHAQTE